MGLPSKLTDEEEALIAKFALIKRKKKALNAKVTHVNSTGKVEQKATTTSAPSKKEPCIDNSKSMKNINTKKEVPAVAIAPKDAKEKAKQLLASGQLKIDKGSEVRSFKRARVSNNVEKKKELCSDASSSKAQVKRIDGIKKESFKNFVGSSEPDLSDHDDEKGSNFSSSKQNIDQEKHFDKNNFNNNKRHNFDNNRNNFDNRNRFDNHNTHNRGNYNNNNNNNNYRQNNLFVSGYGLSKEMLERSFAPYGEVKTIYFDQDRGNGYVTYYRNECAAAAIEALHGEMVEGKTLCVVYARRRNNHDKFDDNRFTWRAGRNNRQGDPERPRDLDSAPAEPPKPVRTLDRMSTKPPEKKERKLVTYHDNILTYEDGGNFEF